MELDFEGGLEVEQDGEELPGAFQPASVVDTTSLRSSVFERIPSPTERDLKNAAELNQMGYLKPLKK